MGIISEEKYETVRQKVMRKRLLRMLDDALVNGQINSYIVEALVDRLDKLMSVRQCPTIPELTSKLLH